MKKAAVFLVSVGLLTTPAQAVDWGNVKPGAFIGARLTVGGKTGARPRAALTIAPTQNRISESGVASMRTGEGIALNLTPGTKPTLTLAGVRADRALGLTRGQQTSSDSKLELSTGGKIAIGVGGALLAGAAIFAIATHCSDEDNHEGLCGDE